MVPHTLQNTKIYDSKQLQVSCIRIKQVPLTHMQHKVAQFVAC